MSKQKGCWVRGAGRENFSRHFELPWEGSLRSRGLQDRTEPPVQQESLAKGTPPRSSPTVEIAVILNKRRKTSVLEHSE